MGPLGVQSHVILLCCRHYFYNFDVVVAAIKVRLATQMAFITDDESATVRV